MLVLLLLASFFLVGCSGTPAPTPIATAATPAPVSQALLRQLSYAEGEIEKRAFASAVRHAEHLLNQFKLFKHSEAEQIRAHKVAGVGYIETRRKSKAIPHYRALIKLDPAHKDEYKRILKKLGH